MSISIHDSLILDSDTMLPVTSFCSLDFPFMTDHTLKLQTTIISSSLELLEPCILPAISNTKSNTAKVN